MVHKAAEDRRARAETATLTADAAYKGNLLSTVQAINTVNTPHQAPSVTL